MIFVRPCIIVLGSVKLELCMVVVVVVVVLVLFRSGKAGGGRVRPTHRIDAATLSEGKFGESGTSLSSDLPISYHSPVATVWIPSVCVRKNFKPVAGQKHGLIPVCCLRFGVWTRSEQETAAARMAGIRILGRGLIMQRLFFIKKLGGSKQYKPRWPPETHLSHISDSTFVHLHFHPLLLLHYQATPI